MLVIHHKDKFGNRIDGGGILYPEWSVSYQNTQILSCNNSTQFQTVNNGR